MSGAQARFCHLLRITTAFGLLIVTCATGATAIFGDNNLDDAALGEGRFDRPYPNNCAMYEKTGFMTPSAGRIAKIDRSGIKTYLGTGETVMRDDVVLSASHLVFRDGRSIIGSGDELVFDIFELRDGRCSLRTYPILAFEPFADDPANPLCAHLDVALFQLGGRVREYRPLALADSGLAEAFRSGRRRGTKVGFANHPSVDFGRHWSIVEARAFPVERRDPSCRNTNLFAHDGDAWSGESGAAFRIDGKLVGIHLRGFDAEYPAYTPYRANIGALLGSDLRERIMKFLAKTGAD